MITVVIMQLAQSYGHSTDINETNLSNKYNWQEANQFAICKLCNRGLESEEVIYLFKISDLITCQPVLSGPVLSGQWSVCEADPKLVRLAKFTSWLFSIFLPKHIENHVNCHSENLIWSHCVAFNWNYRVCIVFVLLIFFARPVYNWSVGHSPKVTA